MTTKHPVATIVAGVVALGALTVPAAGLVRVLQDRRDAWEAKYGVDTAVTGIAAVQIDVSEKLTAALLPFGIIIAGLSLVLLAAGFRSVWVPINATLGYLLSVGAAFGATTLVFNHGFAKEIINLEQPMPVISFLPILLMGNLFGLAMDYEVFLVSRTREEYVDGKAPGDATRVVFVASAPAAAAAVIRFAAFAFFVPEGTGRSRRSRSRWRWASRSTRSWCGSRSAPPCWPCSASAPGGYPAGWTVRSRSATSRASR